MAPLEPAHSPFERLSQSAHLDVLLPRYPDVNIAALIEVGEPGALSRLPARRNLFFDEQVHITVVLKTAAKEDEVREILPQLELILAAHATDAVPQGSGNSASASGKHDVNTKIIRAGNPHDILTTSEHTYVVWKPQVHIPRPRARLQRPAIYFTANLAIGDRQHKSPHGQEGRMLKPFEPLPANVLEPLEVGRAPGSSKVYISESRITKVTLKPSHVADGLKPIRGATRRAFPVVPALFTRIRYSILPDAIVASLHLETSHIVAGRIRILDARFNVSNAHVTGLTDIALPIEAYGGDETILLYKVSSNKSAERAVGAEQSPVSVSVRAEAFLDQGSRIVLEVDWQAHIDLTHVWREPIHRWSRAASHASHQKSLSLQSIGKSSLELASTTSERAEGGVVFRLGAAATTHETSEFKISVHCNNRSSRARRFGLVMIQPRKSRFSAQTVIATEITSHLIENALHTSQFERSKPPDTLDLNPDARIGPLPPAACFEAHMSFMALHIGVLDLGVLRILDLDTKQIVDVRELPDVIALERSEDPKASLGKPEKQVQSNDGHDQQPTSSI